MPILIWLFLVPLLTSLMTFFLPIDSGKFLKKFAIGMSLIPLAILFFEGSSMIGSEVNYEWIASMSIHFKLKIDSLSLIFLYLTATIIPVSLLAVDSKKLSFPHFFYGLILLLQAFLIGFFTSGDLVVFTLFWEAMLLPLYFIISIWGGEQRQKAAIKFLLYMIAGSVLLVAAILFLYLASGKEGGAATFDLEALSKIASSAPYAPWIFAIFILAFAVKTPLFPFHAWLPDAYCQAPLTGTILLSAVLSKAGIYGILRIGMEFFPSYMIEWAPILLGFSITGVLYGGLAAWMQKDYKRLIAYSSFSHVNFILVGLFVWNITAHTGAILQVINHAITITALFIVAAWLEERLGSTKIGAASGLAKFMPHLCWLTLFFVAASLALPGLNNFIGEFLIFFGLWGMNPWLAAILGLSVILSVIYMLRWMQKVYFESPVFFRADWVDITSREFMIALPLVILTLWIGIYPMPVLKLIEPAAKKTVAAAAPQENLS